MSDELMGIKEESGLKNRAEELELERKAVAAQYLGYSNDPQQWPEELLKQKYERLKATIEILRAFTDESRVEIITFLMYSGGGPLPSYSVSDIAERFHISMSTVSHHLQEMKRSGIVKVERRGKERYYQIDLDYLIEKIGELYHKLLWKREMVTRGTQPCPAEMSPEKLAQFAAEAEAKSKADIE